MTKAQKTNEVSPDALDTRQLLRILAAVRQGDFTVRMPVDTVGVAGKVADAFNDVVELNERMAQRVRAPRHVVGKEGKITQRATLVGVGGSWARLRGVGQHADRRPGPPDHAKWPA